MTQDNYLNADEYLHHAPEQPGTIHVHHCKEGHGNDKLYVTRKEDGTILAYCHHCHLGGSYRVAGARALQRRKKNTESENCSTGSNERGISSGNDSSGKRASGGSEDSGRSDANNTSRLSKRSTTRDFKTWRLDAKRWWLEYGLTIPEQRYFGVEYDGMADEIILPIMGTLGEQRKPFRPGAPKYITDGSMEHDIIVSRKPSNTVVVVEDLRSAYKISRDYNVLPLMGTNLQDFHVNKLHSFNPVKVVVWLDNDNSTVVKHARNIRNRLNATGLNVSRVVSIVDPKACTKEQIKDEVER